MAHIRTEFSDRQKAEIFARDRATCCFSGANLWLLDAPLRPGFQMGWVDHIRPSSRGGKAAPIPGTVYLFDAWHPGQNPAPCKSIRSK